MGQQHLEKEKLKQTNKQTNNKYDDDDDNNNNRIRLNLQSTLANILGISKFIITGQVTNVDFVIAMCHSN